MSGSRGSAHLKHFGSVNRRHDLATHIQDKDLRESRSAEVPALVPCELHADGGDGAVDALVFYNQDLVNSWPSLPDVVKTGILAMVDATEGERRNARR